MLFPQPWSDAALARTTAAAGTTAASAEISTHFSTSHCPEIATFDDVIFNEVVFQSLLAVHGIVAVDGDVVSDEPFCQEASVKTTSYSSAPRARIAVASLSLVLAALVASMALVSLVQIWRALTVHSQWYVMLVLVKVMLHLGSAKSRVTYLQ